MLFGKVTAERSAAYATILGLPIGVMSLYIAYFQASAPAAPVRSRPPRTGQDTVRPNVPAAEEARDERKPVPNVVVGNQYNGYMQVFYPSTDSVSGGVDDKAQLLPTAPEESRPIPAPRSAQSKRSEGHPPSAVLEEEAVPEAEGRTDSVVVIQPPEQVPVVEPPAMLRVKGKAKVSLPGAESSLCVYTDSFSDSYSLDSPPLENGSVIDVIRIENARCEISPAGSSMSLGWVDIERLIPVPGE